MKKKNNEVQKNKIKSSNTSRRHKSATTVHIESEEKYRTILESIEDSYYEVDLAGNFTFSNNALCKLSGYSKKELLGMNNRQFIDKETAKEIFKMFNKVYNTGEPSKGFDWQMTRKDGTKRYVEASTSLLKDSSGKPTGFRGIIRDITERKKIEEQYRLLADNITEHVWLRDINSLKIIYISPSVEKMYGYPLDEIKNLSLRKLLTEESFQQMVNTFITEMHKAMATEPPAVHKYSFETQARHRDGHLLWMDNTVSFIRDQNGNLTLLLGETWDITERKRTQEALEKSEAQYRLLADNIKDQIWLMDFNFKASYASPSVEKLWGYTVEEINNFNWEKLLQPESLERVAGLLSKWMPITADSPDDILDRSVEIEIRCKDGRSVWEEIRCSFIRDKNGKAVSILGQGRDITERKQMENALKKSEDRYRSVFENAGLPMVIMEDSLLIFMANDRFAEMSGYEKNEIEGKMKFTDFIALGDHNALMKCFSRRKGDKPVEYECRIAHRNGEKFDVLIRIGLIPDASQFIASFTDITSRKQAEVALLESRENLQKENIRLRSSIRERYRFCDIIGKSRGMQEVYEFILQAAATQANVIIYGESGTGKELVAKAIHETSDRNKKGFVTVHCGAIPETLMESEFFGYKKGAFTGANIDRHGYLDEADGGTLFLDEIGEIGLNMQVKLLRGISGDGYTPVGSSTTKNADVRIIAATNRNLRDLVKREVMREDFFYRIHILPIYLPPLRERKDDLLLLVDHFLQLYDRNHPPLPGHIAEALLNYEWPGNIRELQNVLHRYLTLKRLDFAGMPAARPKPSEIGAKDDDSIKEVSAANTVNGKQTQTVQEDAKINKEDFSLTLKSFERNHIMKALSENNWHRHRTALALGINRKTLFRKMQKFGLTR
jgi:PAS domain S-box-containing protein